MRTATDPSPWDATGEHHRAAVQCHLVHFKLQTYGVTADARDSYDIYYFDHTDH